MNHISICSSVKGWTSLDELGQAEAGQAGERDDHDAQHQAVFAFAEGDDFDEGDAERAAEDFDTVDQGVDGSFSM